MAALRHPTLYFTRWRELLSDDTLLGLQLDDVIDGVSDVPVLPDPSHEGITLPPLTAEERGAIERADHDARVTRERALFCIERRKPSIAMPERPAMTLSERAAAARVTSLARVAREREAKQAKVREVIARHLATQHGAEGAKERK